jgi:hypothetical protein
MVTTLDGGTEVAEPLCQAYCLFHFSEDFTMRIDLVDVYTPWRLRYMLLLFYGIQSSLPLRSRPKLPRSACILFRLSSCFLSRLADKAITLRGQTDQHRFGRLWQQPVPIILSPESVSILKDHHCCISFIANS